MEKFPELAAKISQDFKQNINMFKFFLNGRLGAGFQPIYCNMFSFCHDIYVMFLYLPAFLGMRAT